MAEIHDLTALQQWQELQAGGLTPRQLTDHYLDRIERLNPRLGAFVTVTPEAARARARFVTDNVARTAPLWGLPFGDKDLWQRAGVRTTFGSRVFAEFVPEASDEIVLTLDRAGGVSLGKTNAPEFGLPSYTESLAAPPARNPWDVALGAGGSSGGAAVAVAAGMLPFAPGSDGGGSIRIPAAACGVVGVKPSRGRVPAGSGLESLGGLVVDGPIARTVADAALLLDGMIDRTPSGVAERRFAVTAGDDAEPFLAAAVRGEGRFQLGVMTTSAWDTAYEIDIAPEARAALDTAVAALERLGHGMEAVALEPDDGYAPAFRTLWQAGAARLPIQGDAENLLEPLTRWLLGRGQALDARTLADALVWLAGYERRFIGRLSAYDAVLTPALAMTPRPIGWFDQHDGERNFEQQVQYTPFTSMLNATGLPAIVLPVSLTADRLPMGVQLIGRPGGERTLFALAAQLERVLRFSAHRPPTW